MPACGSLAWIQYKEERLHMYARYRLCWTSSGGVSVNLR